MQNTQTIYILKETQEMVISLTNSPSHNATDHQDVARKLINNKNNDDGEGEK